jgi:hypothetical protein
MCGGSADLTTWEGLSGVHVSVGGLGEWMVVLHSVGGSMWLCGE